MAHLKLFKLDVLPSVLEPSALYFIKGSNNRFTIYLTTNTGNIAYRSPDSTDVYDATIAIINSLLNQPGGIAGLDLDGNLIANIVATGIDGQDGSLMSNNDYVWVDVTAPFAEIASVISGNRPSYGTYMSGFRGLLFSRDTMNQVWVDFHIPHNIALGTAVFPHVHWMPTDDNAGTVRWGFQYMIAKGHGQQKFLTSNTIYVNHAFPANSSGTHFVTEVPEASGIISADIEPDTFIKMRIFRDAGNAADTYNDYIHAWQADLHCQVARIGTRHRTPDFFSP